MSASIVIIGASTRAAAFSAARAGLRPWCVDLFADADLCRHFPVRKVALDAYPNGLLAALAGAPAAPIVYTGALENHPGLIARLPSPVWGNPAAVVRAVRSPQQLAACLAAHGLPGPAVRAEAPSAHDRCGWLLKPRRGAGGLGIRPYEGQAIDRRRAYLQERIDGPSAAAIFLGRADGQADLLGVTRQLVGTSWVHAGPFQYAGSIGPLPLAADLRAAWVRLGQVLVEAFGLRGLFGVDAVMRDGVPWPVEVNPRTTASVEVLERSLGISLLALHRAVFEKTPMPALPHPATAAVHGKAILYAARELVIPAGGPWEQALDQPFDTASHADIPHAGEVIGPGRPILTVFAQGGDVAGCLRRLRENVAHLDRALAQR